MAFELDYQDLIPNERKIKDYAEGGGSFQPLSHKVFESLIE